MSSNARYLALRDLLQVLIREHDSIDIIADTLRKLEQRDENHSRRHIDATAKKATYQLVNTQLEAWATRTEEKLAAFLKDRLHEALPDEGK